ncbi:hypothetical protein Ahu01nite_067530 [Winogradskya humida]|uniref:Uncharacterized protein n=1 Tax=Winogradskya humida TaxID=113566 RepID=A0ABQ3ZYI7_9ACTN|nr:hypothetical protein Ahu01nite_067530 [Actinoplanes humidus]
MSAGSTVSAALNDAVTVSIASDITPPAGDRFPYASDRPLRSARAGDGTAQRHSHLPAGAVMLIGALKS